MSNFIAHVLSHLRRAAEKGVVYAIDLHPGVLAKHDPGCEFLIAALAEARGLGIPTLDMNQIYGWQLARRERAKSGPYGYGEGLSGSRRGLAGVGITASAAGEGVGLPSRLLQKRGPT